MPLLNTFPKNVAADGKATVDLIVGGAAQTYAAASTADVLILIDSQDELKSVQNRPGIIKIGLGGNDTALTLLDRLKDDPRAIEIRRDYEERPNVLLCTGMGQDPRLGELACYDLIRSGKLDQTAQDVLNRLLVATNGHLAHVEIRELNSNAGGMGSGGAPEVGGFFVDLIEKASSATVHHRMIRIGAMTYVTVAPRASANCATLTEKDINRLLTSRPVYSVRDCECVELPIRDRRGHVVGADRCLRGQLSGTFYQARFSGAVSRMFDAREVNHRNTNRLGELCMIVPRWSEIITVDEIATMGARYYATFIERMSIDPPMNIVPEANLSVTALAKMEAVPSIELFLHELAIQPQLQGPLATILLHEDKRHCEITVRIAAALGEESSTDINAAVASGNIPADRVQQIRAQLAAFGVSKQNEAARFKDTRDRQRQHLLGSLQSAHRRRASPVERFRESLKSGNQRAKEASERRRCVQEVLEAHRSYSEAQAAAEASTRALADIEMGAQTAVAPLSGTLHAIANEGNRAISQVEFAPFNQVAQKLREAIVASDKDLLRSVLVSSVRSVTLAGLGSLFGTTGDADLILAAIARGDFAWEAPVWGGGTTHAEPRHRLIVLPPITVKDLESLRGAARTRRSELQLVTADSIAAGCAVVALDFYPIERREDLEPPYYRPHRPVLAA